MTYIKRYNLQCDQLCQILPFGQLFVVLKKKLEVNLLQDKNLGSFWQLFVLWVNFLFCNLVKALEKFSSIWSQWIIIQGTQYVLARARAASFCASWTFFASQTLVPCSPTDGVTRIIFHTFYFFGTTFF